MQHYHVTARRIDASGSEATTEGASIALATGIDIRPDAFNPAELLLASLAACMLKGAERAAPMIRFDLRGAAVTMRGVRQDAPPKMISIDYLIEVETEESEARLDLLHRNIRKYGTISNTLDGALVLSGEIRRAQRANPKG